MNFIDFSRKINELKRDGLFIEALAFFKEHKAQYSKDQIKNNKWLVSAILTSIRKTGSSKFVGMFLNEFNIAIDEKLDSMVVNAYGWCLYDNLRNNIYHKNQIVSILTTPIFLIQRNIDDYSRVLIERIFETGLKVGKEAVNEDFQYIYNFCSIFDDNNLSLEENCFENDGRNVCLASSREKWYSEKSKATLELNLFEECYQVSEKALHSIEKFHHNNDLWFARRIALSKKALGNIDEAVEDLKRVYSKKREWFIQKEIAELYFEKNDLKSAFEYAMAAINPVGKIEYKIGLIFLIGKILKTLNKEKEANYHFLLIKRIREENNWRMPTELSAYFNDEINNNTNDTKEIIQVLKKYWSSFNKLSKSDTRKRKQISQVETGVIKNILHDNEKGKNGFIKGTNGDIYFNISYSHEDKDRICVGANVSYTIHQQQDGRTFARNIKVET